eukprot:1151583-Pelagomonas_calceolata.AAC.1
MEPARLVAQCTSTCDRVSRAGHARQCECHIFLVFSSDQGCMEPARLVAQCTSTCDRASRGGHARQCECHRCYPPSVVPVTGIVWNLPNLLPNAPVLVTERQEVGTLASVSAISS